MVGETWTSAEAGYQILDHYYDTSKKIDRVGFSCETCSGGTSEHEDIEGIRTSVDSGLNWDQFSPLGNSNWIDFGVSNKIIGISVIS